MLYQSTKIIELGSCAFRQWRADSHCKFIHGYRLVAKFWFTCDELDERNWVVDFGGLKELKQVLESQFDHTLCIAADDPLRHEFERLHDLRAVDLRIMEKGVGIERTADWCFDVADAHVRGITKNRCWVERVEVWEHDKNSAIVSSGFTRIPEHNPYASDAHVSSINLIAPTPATHTVVAAPAPEVSRAAPVGNKVSSGLGNPFGGTSWGL